MTELDIIHETRNLCLVRVEGGLELRLCGATCSVVIGSPSQGIDRARATMERIERNIGHVRRMYGHY